MSVYEERSEINPEAEFNSILHTDRVELAQTKKTESEEMCTVSNITCYSPIIRPMREQDYQGSCGTKKILAMGINNFYYKILNMFFNR